MAYSDSQNKATQKFIKNNYDEIKIRVSKGKKEKYKKLAYEKGCSLNAYIINLIEQSASHTEEAISSASMVKQTLSSMAIENMYFDDAFIKKIIKVANGEMSSKELRQEVLKQYAR